MPTNERLRLDDSQHIPPFEEPRQGDQRDPRGVIGPAGLHLPFHVHRQLLSEEEVLRGELGT